MILITLTAFQHRILELRLSASAENMNGICSLQLVCSAVLCYFAVGNANSLPCSRQSCKCILLFFWSKTPLPGWTPLTNAVTNATANSPQFALPDFSSNSAPSIFSPGSLLVLAETQRVAVMREKCVDATILLVSGHIRRKRTPSGGGPYSLGHTTSKFTSTSKLTVTQRERGRHDVPHLYLHRP